MGRWDRGSNPLKNGIELLRSGNFADAVVKCQGRTWNVHRALLAARLRFFKAAFTGSFAEATSREIEFPEAIPDSVDIMIRHMYGEDLDLEALDTPLLCVSSWKLADYLQLDSLKEVAVWALEDHLDAMALLASNDQDIEQVQPVWLRHFHDALREVCADTIAKPLQTAFAAFLWVTRFKMLIPETLEILGGNPGVHGQLMHLLVWNRFDKQHEPHVWFPINERIKDMAREIRNQKPITFGDHDVCPICGETEETKNGPEHRFNNPFPIMFPYSRSKRRIGYLVMCKVCVDMYNESRSWPWGPWGKDMGHKVKAWAWADDE